MLDIFSRKVIRWEVHATETGDLAKAFIEDAITANGGARPDYIHADNGTSMTSKPVSQLLSDLNITDSHSRPHVCYDNAAAESWNATFKKELIHLHLWKDAAHVRQASFRYIEAYYNRTRIQKEIGYLSPAEYEVGFDRTMAKAA